MAIIALTSIGILKIKLQKYVWKLNDDCAQFKDFICVIYNSLQI